MLSAAPFQAAPYFARLLTARWRSGRDGGAERTRVGGPLPPRAPTLPPTHALPADRRGGQSVSAEHSTAVRTVRTAQCVPSAAGHRLGTRDRRGPALDVALDPL